MKNKHISPTQRFFAKSEKPPIGSHTSGSTIQNSGHGLVKQSEIVNKIPRPESQTIKFLRQDLKNIKQQVTKLIQEGFVKVPHSGDWLQSSGAISVFISKSKSSRSPFMNNDFIIQPSNINYRKQLQFDFGNDQQTKNLKQQCEKLRNLCKKKQRKQADLLANQKQLQNQVKALKNCNQQLTKCIQILQTTLKQANLQMKITIEQKNLISQQLQKNQLQKQSAYKQQLILKQLNIRLQQQISFQKAENNQLIRIIQIKENQVQQLKKKFALQIKQIQIQYCHELEQQRISFQTQHQFQLQQHSRNVQIFRQNQFYAEDYENMQLQIQGLKKQLANRQRLMLMMLNDIKNLQAELKVADTQHQLLIKCQKLIDSLNQTIIKINAKKLGNKYTYCF